MNEPSNDTMMRSPEGLRLDEMVDMQQRIHAHSPLLKVIAKAAPGIEGIAVVLLGDGKVRCAISTGWARSGAGGNTESGDADSDDVRARLIAGMRELADRLEAGDGYDMEC